MVSSTSRERGLSNQQLAATFSEVADLLEVQRANRFRVRAYRCAAETLLGLDTSVHQILRSEGVDGLTRLPGIGRSLAHALDQLVHSGRLPMLERLRGGDAVERMFASVPDIGAGLARRIHEHLGIETLAELEEAANDGRLAKVPGMGSKRVRAVRESLAGRFVQQRQRLRNDRQPTYSPIPVEELLSIDQQYRQQADQGKLPQIAPRQFNPFRQAWLPVLHTTRGDRSYTALFSNTARAHEMGTTHDWVVIYRDDHHDHGRWTVITAHYGPLRGFRIVRGRERECEAVYREIKTKQTTLRNRISSAKGGSDGD